MPKLLERCSVIVCVCSTGLYLPALESTMNVGTGSLPTRRAITTSVARLSHLLDFHVAKDSNAVHMCRKKQAIAGEVNRCPGVSAQEQLG